MWMATKKKQNKKVQASCWKNQKGSRLGAGEIVPCAFFVSSNPQYLCKKLAVAVHACNTSTVWGRGLLGFAGHQPPLLDVHREPLTQGNKVKCDRAGHLTASSSFCVRVYESGLERWLSG